MSNLKRKKLSFTILDILRKYTDADHRLSQKDIIDILRTEYDMDADRKSVKRNLTSLWEIGFPIDFEETPRMYPNKNGVMEESFIQHDFYIEREFTDSELRLLIDSLLFSKHIPYRQCKELVEKLERLSNKYFSAHVKHVHTMTGITTQNNQLFWTIEILDEAIEKGYRIEKIYYLCPYRRTPSIDSIRSPKKGTQAVLPENVIGCLSFKEDIGNWLEKVSQFCLIKGHYGFLLSQFKDVIKVMCANKNNQEMLYEALGLHDRQTLQVSKEVEVLLSIMSLDQNALWFRIRDGYLRKALKLNSKDGEEKYKLVDTPEGAQIDKHSLYVIKKVATDVEIAWICVEANLYIVSKYAVGGLKGKGDYYWKHLSPKGTQEFQLRNANASISDSDEIDISKLLEQIDSALSNQE